MPIAVQCANCGRQLRARDEFSGRRAECPSCGELVLIGTLLSAAESMPPSPSALSSAPPRPTSTSVADPQPIDIVEFLDPPQPVAAPLAAARPGKPVLQQMLEALLDPRAIHWMLTIGGGLAVLGLIVWLVSVGLFADPILMAILMGVGSLAVLGGGWWVTLKTRFHIAGQALTFLGCVVAPLNLWFYHAQDLITLDNHLWLGGLVCVGLYVATVYVLRNPLFLYAVEAGVTLTALLLLADLGLVRNVGNLSLFLIGLAFASIHAERAFPPSGEFDRRRFGLPLFWSGHAQLATGLLCLLGSQALGWVSEPLGIDWPGNLLTRNNLLAGGLWLAGTYLYLYSDLVVRRVGVYTYFAAFSLLMAEVAVLMPHLNHEGLIAVLAITAIILQVADRMLTAPNERVRRHLAGISAVLSELPVLLGVLLHLRATSEAARALGYAYETGWAFVGVMLLVAATNRAAAWFSRHVQPALSETHFFFSAAALLVAAAGLLRQVGWTDWSLQAPALMLVPIGYLLASRMWRGHSPERPLGRVAHAATGVILAGTLVAALEQGELLIFRPVVENTKNLLLGLAFAIACVFYVLAGIFRRRSANAYFATAAGCGAVWQFLGYFGVPTAWYELLYALFGIGLLVAARSLGLETQERYTRDGARNTVLRGRGLTAFQCGNAVLSVALVIAFLRGLTDLAVSGSRALEWLNFVALAATTAAAIAANWLVAGTAWRRWYLTAAVALGGVLFLEINVLIDLSGWRKLEIFCVAVGLLLLGVSHFGRFRERREATDESITLGLWVGSLLTAVPPFIAMLSERYFGAGPSLVDELALLTFTILMLVSGCSWQIKSTTLIGGGLLALYLMILVVSIAYHPQVAVGVYLLIGGGLIFGAGVLLSIYRDRLLAIPARIAKREGLFRVIAWR